MPRIWYHALPGKCDAMLTDFPKQKLSKLNIFVKYSVTKTADAQGNQVVVYGAVRDGNSQCPLFEDNVFCNFADKYCTKTVQAQYLQGSIAEWLITKGCGACAYSTSSTVPCDPTLCVGSACSGCYWQSDGTPIITRCFQCTTDFCNAASTPRRRAAHHVAAAAFSAAALLLLLRKCRRDA